MTLQHTAVKTTFYAVTYQKLREVARTHGYALALHGSLMKDLDVVAVPWVEEAIHPDELAKHLCEAAGGFIVPGGKQVDGGWQRVDDPVKKPHGRLSYTIHLGGEGGYVDLSVMPPMRLTEIVRGEQKPMDCPPPFEINGKIQIE